LSVLIDTGVFYAFYNKRDVHHLDSICILFHALEGKWGSVFTTLSVVSETATLLRYRIGINTTLAFLHALERAGVRIIFFDEWLYQKTIKVLSRYREKNLSFTDASIIATLINFKISLLATYDERSYSGIVSNVIGREYSQTIPSNELKKAQEEARKWK